MQAREVETGERVRQNRGWTPARLAEALRGSGLPGSCATLKRACAAGEIPHTRSDGGHIRIEPQWVADTFPTLAGAAHLP